MRRRAFLRCSHKTLLATACDTARHRGFVPLLDVVDTPLAGPAIALYRGSGWTELGRVSFELAGDALTEIVFRAPA